MGSVFGALLYFVAIPINPVFLYAYIQETADHYVYPWITFVFGAAFETVHMYTSWSPIFMINCLNFMMTASVSASTHSVYTEHQLGRLSVTQAIQCYRVLYMVVQKFNGSFSNLLTLHMVHNVVQFWLMAYQLIRYGLDIPFMMLMIFWANVYYEAMKIIVSKVGYDVHSMSENIRRSMARSLGKDLEGRKWKRRMVWSCRSFSLRYGRFCELKPVIVLDLLYVATSNLIVFIKM